MSYYFCIVGTRDNPLYQAELASRAGSSGPASFFGSSSSSSSNNNLTGSGAAAGSQSGANSAAGGASGTGSTGLSRNASTSSTTGGVFGFGNALGSITSGFGGGAGRDGGGGAGTAQGGVGAPAGSGGDGKGLGFGRYNDKHVLQMIAHSALDVVEDKQFMSQAMWVWWNNGAWRTVRCADSREIAPPCRYLKGVDRMNEWTTSALIAPGSEYPGELGSL